MEVYWFDHLPAEDKRTCLAEFAKLRSSKAVMGMDDVRFLQAVDRFLNEWKNTAQLYQEGLADELKRPLTASDIDGRQVPYPQEEDFDD